MWKKEYKPKHLTLSEMHNLWILLGKTKSEDLFEIMDAVDWQGLWEVFYGGKRPNEYALRYYIHLALENCAYLAYAEVMNGKN